MLTIDDCIALCQLSEDEVLAIAEHQRIPEMAATELASYLLEHPRCEERHRQALGFPDRRAGTSPAV